MGKEKKAKKQKKGKASRKEEEEEDADSESGGDELEEAGGRSREAAAGQEPLSPEEAAAERGRPKKRTRAERAIMGLEDRLSAAARQTELLAEEVEDWKGRASRSEEVIEDLQGRVRKFAEVAAKIKQGSARKIERRDSTIALLEGKLVTSEEKLRTFAVTKEQRDRYLSTIWCLHRRLAERRAREVTAAPEAAAQMPRSALRSRGSKPSGADGSAGRHLVFDSDEVLAAVLPVPSVKGEADLWLQCPGASALCEQCERRVPTSQGFLLSDQQRSQFAQEAFLCNDCAQQNGIVAMAMSTVGSEADEVMPAEPVPVGVASAPAASPAPGHALQPSVAVTATAAALAAAAKS